jgi:SAM-dependent methyltransferase
MKPSLVHKAQRVLGKIVNGTDVRVALASAREELAGVQAQLAAVPEQIASLQEQIANLPEQIASLQEQIVRMRERVSNLHDALCKTPECLLGSDGFPVPPADLRHLVTDEYHYIPSFFDVGALCARRIVESLRKHGVEMDQFRAVLDFGCGCGRTIRHFRFLGKERLYGTDYNPRLIDWCKQNLPFAQFSLNNLEPALGYALESFDLVYAFSVFTHLTHALQLSWMSELSRIIRPGGYLVITTIDENHLDSPALDTAVKEKVRAGQFAVVNYERAGANECESYYPYPYVKERMARGFEIIEHIPNGVGQTFYLMQKQPSAHQRRIEETLEHGDESRE